MKRRRLLRLGLPAAAVVALTALGATAAASDDAPFHPPVPILDAGGVPVVDSGAAASPMRTCGACHDVEFVADHSAHADAGASLLGTTTIHAWDLGPGWFGAWDPVTGLGRLAAADDPEAVAGWLATLGARHAGGGPVADLVELDCFLCHLPAVDAAARADMLALGRPGDAATATLLATGAVSWSGDAWDWNASAFDPDGSIGGLVPRGATAAACGSCHGLAVTKPEVVTLGDLDPLADRTTLLTGAIVAGDRMLESGVNLSGKDGLSRAWDVHAERVVGCTDCHHAANNPVLFREDPESRPEHLLVDGRRVDIGVYLQRPDHRLVTETCTTCHDGTQAHDWLPYRARHLEALACETCHIPTVYGAALAVVDHTMVDADGGPRTEWRGIEGPPESAASLVTGYQPVILADEQGKLAPHNLVATWFWVAGGRPVTPDELTTALMPGGAYAPEVLAAFDADGDGALSSSELGIVDTAREQAVRQRLAAAGFEGAVISGELRAYEIHHGVATGEWATRDCTACHGSRTLLDDGMALASFMPGGAAPQPVAAAADGAVIPDRDGGLAFDPATGDDGLYVFGADRVVWIDLVGLAVFLMVLGGVALHAWARWRTSRARPHEPAPTEPAYLYSVYERLWHWLQTLVILALLATGLVIHAPDAFGIFAFDWVVAVHNLLAAILVANALLSAFYHVASGEIRQYLPRPQGFFDRAIAQGAYYLQGIFRGERHPFEKDARAKLNPLQQITYVAILNVLLPLQIVTGVLIWGAQRWPDVLERIGGLPLVAPLHALVAWLFAAFVVMHVYLTTTGHTPLSNIRAMITGWDEVEAHQPEEVAAP